MASQQTIGHARLVRVLHGSLLAGQVVLFVIVAFLSSRTGPLLGDAAPIVGQVLTGVAVVQLGIAVLVLRPRGPERLSSVDREEYWANPAARTAAQLVWGIGEAATVVALVAYLLSGLAIAGAMAVVAMVTFAWLRPASFEG